MTTNCDPEQRQHGDPPSAARSALSSRSLVLEDNALIAMEIEAYLVDLGAETVDVASTSAQALNLIARFAYEFALLDVNLGGETSFRVAEALHAAGVPHAFSTGYGGLPWASCEHARMPVLTKPFDAFMLRNVVAKARQNRRCACRQ